MWRFIQEDPIGTKDDINLYRYVANNPMKYTDRYGKEKVLIRYSPNHWYDQFSTKEFAQKIEEAYSQKFSGKWNWSISVVNVSSFDDYQSALNNFNSNTYKKWNITYIWHNMWWLSKNISDDKINTLPKINWDKLPQIYPWSLSREA